MRAVSCDLQILPGQFQFTDGKVLVSLLTDQFDTNTTFNSAVLRYMMVGLVSGSSLSCCCCCCFITAAAATLGPVASTFVLHRQSTHQHANTRCFLHFHAKISRCNTVNSLIRMRSKSARFYSAFY